MPEVMKMEEWGSQTYSVHQFSDGGNGKLPRVKFMSNDTSSQEEFDTPSSLDDVLCPLLPGIFGYIRRIFLGSQTLKVPSL